MTRWLLEVTDLKQYTYCPRIVFYRYCLPRIRPLTFLMEEGIRGHREEEEHEERRSLHNYGLKEGERVFHLALRSETLGLIGRIDLAIAAPARSAHNAEAIVVEYKHSEHKAGAHFKLQLAAYALLIEEAWGLPVRRAFLYSLPLRRAEPIPITPHLRKKVIDTVTQIQRILDSEIMPAPPRSQAQCLSCEFRRFCNDVV
ncbi:MAG: CRISPR-associated protein Cas4 [Ktedonobacteraceae bacterium]|nr:CRISPR-associated protein Cas4 [Ktedonobacteraceae bacterium]